jgi:hypothetical protein
MAVKVGSGVHPIAVLAIATAVLGPLAVLVLVSMLWVVLVTAAAVSSGSFVGLVPAVVVLLGYALAAGAFVRMRKSGSKRSKRIWAVVAVALGLAASVPALWLLIQLFLDEWCESQPGGRGYGNISSLEEIPAACR